MSEREDRVVETITLGQARSLILAMAAEQSLLLLSPPGVGKSDVVAQAAAAAGLPCKSLLGTQIAPEDVSGIPRIVGERSVFCPPRVLLPERAEPFCLFLDELPACPPDVQKAFYSLLLERRLGEHALPPGTWVVAAGNRLQDRALVRAMSSALVNRVIILNIRVDLKEWLAWAREHAIRPEILAFLVFLPDALLREPPNEPAPFSTPRAWASLSRALDLAEEAGILDAPIRRALAFGRVSPGDAAIFCLMVEEQIANLRTAPEYVERPELIPTEPGARWLVLCRVREAVARGELRRFEPESINRFLMALPREHRFALLVDRVHDWGALGADPALRESLREVTGL